MKRCFLLVLLGLLSCGQESTETTVSDTVTDSQDCTSDCADAELDVAEPIPVSCSEEACGATCPPTGPFGSDPNETITDVSFLDCDGNPVTLHDLCGQNAAIVVNFYGWCTGCYRIMGETNRWLEDYGEYGFRPIVVITEDTLETPATADYCDRIRAQYDLEATVVYDPEHNFENLYGGADTVLITNQHAEIIMLRRSATLLAIERTLVEELAQ